MLARTARARSPFREDHRIAGGQVARDRAERHGEAVEVARRRVARRGQFSIRNRLMRCSARRPPGSRSLFQSKLTPAADASGRFGARRGGSAGPASR